MVITEITSLESFDELIASKDTVVMFTALWCQPCQTIKGKYTALSEEHPNCTYVTVDGDDMEEICMKYDIDAFPTFQFYRGGASMNELAFAGANEDKLVAHIAKFAACIKQG